VKNRPHLVRALAALVPCLALGACSGSGFSLKSSDGLEKVDELLSHVERVRVESLVSKERAQAALESLKGILAPEFRGDAVVAHQKFAAAVEQSEDQADTLRNRVKPMKRTGEAMFAQWTEDLESFGNLSMRQRSQERLEATRARYDVIVSTALAAQLAYDAFNGDLSDQVLFLENDFNASSVAVVAQEQEGLRSRAKELARRLEAVNAACQAYVEYSAPQAELERAPETTSTSKETTTAPAAPKKTTTPKPRAQPAKPAPTPAPNG
jgi:hypothetical protein